MLKFEEKSVAKRLKGFLKGLLNILGFYYVRSCWNGSGNKWSLLEIIFGPVGISVDGLNRTVDLVYLLG